jgi:peptidoglycan hydrolase CwlO-like protein
MELFWHFVSWGISFALIYWLATDNLWLCFFIASASSTAQYAITNTKRDIIEMLLPMSQSYDDNINSLHERTQNLESEVDELKELIAELKIKLDYLED